MGTSCWICRRVSTSSCRSTPDTGATRHTSTRRAVRLRTHAGDAVLKRNSSPCSSCATHRADELAAGMEVTSDIPTVSPAKNSLVYFISIAYIDHPVWRGHREEAKRGPPCEHRITRNEGAMVPFLLPCATTGLSSIAAWCGSGATPRGQQWPPACTLPHVRDGLRVRCRATFCPCGRSSMGRPVHHQFLRNALPDLTTIVTVTAY